MQALMLILGGAFVSLFNALTSFLGRRAAVYVTLGTVFVAGWVAVQTLMFATYNALAMAVPAEMFTPLKMIGMIIPSNFFSCIAAMVAFKIAIWLWSVQREYIRMVVSAS